ncbi:Serine protease Do-like HtrA [subsurface metagenome]
MVVYQVAVCSLSAKEGIVSRLGVSITVSPGQTLADLIETSAAINPGNSGGPLVNMAGEVIGITSVKIVTVEVEGIGYAISIDSAAPIIQELVRSGYVTRPWLGIILTNVDQWLAAKYRLSVNTGVFITEVASGSPADKAGLKPQDVIAGFGDQEITNSGELIQAIHNSQVGQEVEITFWRGDTKMTTLATLAESPPPG